MRKTVYWISTCLGAAILVFGGLNEVMHSERITRTMAHLGYPAFLPTLLGTWKLLAVAAILAPRVPRLKEWAYAGVFFDLTGAITSHAVVGDGIAQLAPPTVVLLLLGISWATRPADRQLVAAVVPRIARFAPRPIVTATGETLQVPVPGKLTHLQLRRFAGCPICNLHLASVAKRHDELTAAGVREVVVFHSTPDELRKYQPELPFPVIADAEKRLYAELGIERSLLAVLDPRAWPAIVRGVIRTAKSGKLPLGKHEGGSLGLPGDFLIDSDGRIVASKIGAHAYDQWSVDEVLALTQAHRA
jgi:peroxiredoxin